MPDYENYPRPQEDYFEVRHDWLTQGDVFQDAPISQLGPDLLILENPPESAEPIPQGLLPVVTYVWTTGLGMLLSNTCDFRHPAAVDIDNHPLEYPDPDDVYHNGFLRVAPIFPLDDCPWLPKDEDLYRKIRRFDHYRRFMYLPALEGTMPESVVALQMADLLHLDLIRHLPRLTQLTRAARQQLDRKLVLLDTGAPTRFDDFDPDMN